LYQFITTVPHGAAIVMRPVLAIAPLAVLLAFIGPSPDDSIQAMSALKDRLFGASTPEVLMRSHETHAVDIVIDKAPTLSAFNHAHGGAITLRH
jgi:hypothetical protein